MSVDLANGNSVGLRLGPDADRWVVKDANGDEILSLSMRTLPHDLDHSQIATIFNAFLVEKERSFRQGINVGKTLKQHELYKAFQGLKTVLGFEQWDGK